jgi:hypothetical protein
VLAPSLVVFERALGNARVCASRRDAETHSHHRVTYICPRFFALTKLHRRNIGAQQLSALQLYDVVNAFNGYSWIREVGLWRAFALHSLYGA